jgi:hypothetical protein
MTETTHTDPVVALGDHDPMMGETEWNEVLKQVAKLPHYGVVLEYGTGWSTIHLARKMHLTQILISVEHVEKWHKDMLGVLGYDHDHQVPLALTQLQLAPLASYCGDMHKYAEPSEECGAGCALYIGAAAVDSDWPRVGLVLVDGIARGPCLAYIRTKLNPGTTVLLHDYAGRETWYDWAVSLYEKVEQVESLLVLRVPLAK